MIIFHRKIQSVHQRNLVAAFQHSATSTRSCDRRVKKAGSHLKMTKSLKGIVSLKFT